VDTAILRAPVDARSDRGGLRHVECLGRRERAERRGNRIGGGGVPRDHRGLTDHRERAPAGGIHDVPHGPPSDGPGLLAIATRADGHVVEHHGLGHLSIQARGNLDAPSNLAGGRRAKRDVATHVHERLRESTVPQGRQCVIGGQALADRAEVHPNAVALRGEERPLIVPAPRVPARAGCRLGERRIARHHASAPRLAPQPRDRAKARVESAACHLRKPPRRVQRVAESALHALRGACMARQALRGRVAPPVAQRVVPGTDAVERGACRGSRA